MTFWPRGWVLSQGRVLLEHGGLFEQGGRAFTGEGYLFDILGWGMGAFSGKGAFRARGLI